MEKNVLFLKCKRFRKNNCKGTAKFRNDVGEFYVVNTEHLCGTQPYSTYEDIPKEAAAANLTQGNIVNLIGEPIQMEQADNDDDAREERNEEFPSSEMEEVVFYQDHEKSEEK